MKSMEGELKTGKDIGTDETLSDQVLDTMEGDINQRAKSKTEEFLKRTESKAKNIIDILNSGKEISDWSDDEKELVKKYLSPKEKKQVDEKRLTEKQRESLKKQCEAIIGIVSIRSGVLERADKNSDGFLKITKDLSEKIKKGEIKDEIEARVSVSKISKPEVKNDIEYDNDDFDTDFEKDKDYSLRKDKRDAEILSSDLKASMEEDLGDGIGESSDLKKRKEKEALEVEMDREWDEFLERKKKEDEELGSLGTLDDSKVVPKVNKSEEYWSKGFWGKLKIELKDLFGKDEEGRGIFKKSGKEIREDVFGLEGEEKVGDKYNEALREVDRANPLPLVRFWWKGDKRNSDSLKKDLKEFWGKEVGGGIKDWWQERKKNATWKFWKWL